jgi:mannosyl-oligosaccharide alpha-1,2-mannosidase
VFEITIKYLGGLLGAYNVSGGKYPILLQKADQLGEFLFHAFHTPNGIPVPYYWPQRNNDGLDGENGVLIAQIGENRRPSSSKDTDY